MPRMHRRTVLKRIGASSTVAVGAAGVGSARQIDAFAATREITPAEAQFITAEVDGESRVFTFEEFDRHPDTQSLSDVDFSSTCCFECKECCDLCCPDEPCCFGSECGECNLDSCP